MVPRFGRTALSRHVDSEEANTIAILELDETMALKLNVASSVPCLLSGFGCRRKFDGSILIWFYRRIMTSGGCEVENSCGSTYLNSIRQVKYYWGVNGCFSKRGIEESKNDQENRSNSIIRVNDGLAQTAI